MSQQFVSTQDACPAIVVFDIDGVVRDVGGSYRRALADTVEQFTEGAYRPASREIDRLKSEGQWNNDWHASQELIYRYFEAQGRPRAQIALDFDALVAFFQSRYRGPDEQNWTGYICQEPLLMSVAYLESLTQAGIKWGFFSGAPRVSAEYVLKQRLGLQDLVLIAMEDAPGKPDPTGLLAAVCQLENNSSIPPSVPVFYVGDTVADLYTVCRVKDWLGLNQLTDAKNSQTDFQEADAALPSLERTWIGVGVLPPHVQTDPKRQTAYTQLLQEAGAAAVFKHVEELTPTQICQLVLG